MCNLDVALCWVNWSCHGIMWLSQDTNSVTFTCQSVFECHRNKRNCFVVYGSVLIGMFTSFFRACSLRFHLFVYLLLGLYLTSILRTFVISPCVSFLVCWDAVWSVSVNRIYVHSCSNKRLSTKLYPECFTKWRRHSAHAHSSQLWRLYAIRSTSRQYLDQRICRCLLR